MASSQEPTQPTQRVLDPRRIGRDSSGLDDDDAVDIILILAPTTEAGIKIVEKAAETRPHHVLFQDSMSSYFTSVPIEEQETIIVGPDGRLETKNWHEEQETDLVGHNGMTRHSQPPAGIALRFSSASHLKSKRSGFVFGRNAATSDIVFGQDSSKRISNQHFRIFLNNEGLPMLEDMSTNGTMVDTVLLKSKEPQFHKARMLSQNTVITISNPQDSAIIRFHVRFPSRPSTAHMEGYEENKRAFMRECGMGEDDESALLRQRPYRPAMKWDGGMDYNILEELGKGAFAIVYKIATKMEGVLYAAKELEKRRFMKDGKLDKKVENELKIMESLRHPNVVQFVSYHDQGDYLYIIMEYARHGDLGGYLNQNGPINEAKAKTLAQQVLSALHHLHTQNVTHRDIKPDNILISKLEPLQVKISDFGLSKMVRHEETFLKTFCGTLLYCAPEVFPQYEQSKKRRRGMPQKAYSSACDIWSFGGVLWNALCGKPPFKGVPDATGQAMYDNIMVQDLDASLLRKHKVSEACIELLTTMLRKDPLTRPTPRECLLHPWLRDGATIPEDPVLQSIVEEDESEEAEQQLSQLSICEEVAKSDDDAGVLSDEEFEMLLDPRQSKRIRTDPLFPRHQLREYKDDSSAAVSPQSDMGADMVGVEESFQPRPRPGVQRLFGEIGQSALQSSGVLQVHANQALSNVGSASSGSQGEVPVTKRNGKRRQVSPGNVPQLDRDVSSSSLFGAESLVRELNMASPQSLGSGQHSPNEPATPKTPDLPPHSSLGFSDKDPSQNSEPTPRANPSTQKRLILLPKTASYYYDALDPSTHNLEYASQVSGIDFVAAQQNATAGASALEDTMRQSNTDRTTETSVASAEGLPGNAKVNLPNELEIKPPPRRVGKLVATPDSIVPSLVLNLYQSKTTWGRLPTNTIVYEDITDVRIPKTAFSIFWKSGDVAVRELSDNGHDWTKMDDLRVAVFACATWGITVNGQVIRQKDDQGRALFGYLHSGDIIRVFNNPREKECLKFKCEFYVGLGQQPRAAGESFEILTGPKLSK